MLSTSIGRLVAGSLLLLATVLVYWPGIDGPALLDDRPNLAPLADIDAGRLALGEYLLAPGAGGLPRPLPKLSFAINWWLAGDRIAAYKLTNLIVHLACAVLLYVLVVRVLRVRGASEPEAAAVGLLTLGLWLLAPLNVSSVLYVVQRMAQLAALFSLCAMLVWVIARESTVPWRRGAGYAVALLVCWPLALASKQSAAVLPALLLVMEWMLLTHLPGHRRALRVLMVLTVSIAIALAMRVALDPAWLMEGYAAREFNLLERLLSQPRALASYTAKLLLLPFGQPLSLFHDDFVVSHSLTQPMSTAPALIGVLAIAAAALATRGTRFALIGFGALFFLGAHAVESSVFPLELYFEHRNYLPAVGVMMALAMIVTYVAAHSERRWLLWIIALALIGLSAIDSARRVEVWRDEQRLYHEAASRQPHSARAQLAMASIELNAGALDEGIARLERAARLLPASARFGLALHMLAAECTRGPSDDDRWQRMLISAESIGSDFYTINAMHWMSGAIASGRCIEKHQRMLASVLMRLRERNVPTTTAERDTARQRAIDTLSSALGVPARP